jgi:3-dehydroquinate synthase
MDAEGIRVNLGSRGYDIAVTHNNSAGIGPFTRQRVKSDKVLVIADEHVVSHAQKTAASLGQAGLKTALEVRPSGENQKSLAGASALYDRLAEFQADRRTLVAAVGGGVIGDLAGFVAATFNRGLPLLMVPTTLLAMVDSSVGGKVAVNHPRAKNLIGTFHQPIGVWIDIATLDTLPDREYRSGLAEVVKYGVILDADFFSYLETHRDAILRRDPSVIRHIVTRCCRLKADVVEKDEREETGWRAILNYGHTFAHAFETAGGYSHWLHGEAVAAGMVCASHLAERRGLISSDITERLTELLGAFSLPTRIASWPVDQLLQTMKSDKKTLSGQLRFVLPRRLGEVALFDDVPEDDAGVVLKEMANES